MGGRPAASLLRLAAGALHGKSLHWTLSVLGTTGVQQRRATEKIKATEHHRRHIKAAT